MGAATVGVESSKGASTMNEICVVCVFFASYRICLGAELKFTFVLSMRKDFGIQII